MAIVEDADRAGRHSGLPVLYSLLAKYGLLLLLAILVAVFSLLLPKSFPTVFNLRNTLGSQAIILLIALGLMVPFAAGVFDLSIGYWVGLSSMLAVGLQVDQKLPGEVAILIVLVLAVVVGLINGMIVTIFKVDSLIATLGSGSIVYGVTEAYSNGFPISGPLPSWFTDITYPGFLSMPWSVWFVLIVTVLLWLLLGYTTIGRRVYVVGENRRAAELAGIPVKSYIQFSFVMSAVLGAAAGIVVASSARVGQPTEGPEYLLPGFTAAFLGTAAIRPGRLNPWGTVIAVMLLAVTLSGLLQLGVPSYVQDFFNGVMLITAMAIAVYASRRRAANSAVSRPKSVEAERETDDIAS